MHFVVENVMATKQLDRNLTGSLSRHGNDKTPSLRNTLPLSYTPPVRHKREMSGSSIALFEMEDSLRKPLYGILMKAPFFNDKKYGKVCYEVSEGGAVKKWTMKMFKFESESGVLCYCDAGSYQKSNQVADDIPTVMLGKCQYFHVGSTAFCQSEPDMDNVDKCQFVFRIDGLTGVHDKSLYLASYTPEDRLKWVTRITNYTQARLMDRVKLKEHQRLKVTISIQDGQIEHLTEELDNLIQLSGYLKSQVKKYQKLAGQMREDNVMLLDKLEVVSKEISGLRNSLKQSSVSNQIARLTLDNNNSDTEEFVSPEVEYLEKFSKYLDFKRNDIIRLSHRGNRPGPSMNIEADKASNNLSKREALV
ncbi:uncharacterized protein LOC134822995 [Bolinopsis microptera]|uniref:uncharacterized protein LOC134822995 n=1 Tax=Bolinopsis microptera TaxID=2820187 RepID=UPI003079B077